MEAQGTGLKAQGYGYQFCLVPWIFLPLAPLIVKPQLSPSVHKLGEGLIYSGLSAALGHEIEPNGVSDLAGLA